MTIKIKIKSDLENLRMVENLIDTVTNDYNIKHDDYGKILIATLEAVNNAIVHGNKSDKKKDVIIEAEYENKILNITVTDQGKGFNPETIPDPTKPENIEAVNGRGIFIMKKLADEIKFSRKGNIVKITFNI